MEENCKVECNMQLYIKTCDCLPYFFYNMESVETCDFKSIECIVLNRGELKYLELFLEINVNFLDILHNANKNTSLDCSCPSQCISQNYDLRISSTPILLNMTTAIDPFL